MTEIPWLSFTVWSPFVAALVLMCLPGASKGAIRLVSVMGAGASLFGSVVIARAYDLEKGGYQLRETFELVPSLGIRYDLAVDGWGVSLLLLTGIIILAGCFATWTLEERPKEFYILLLVLVTGVFGVFVSLDLFIFFLFYEVAVLPMYLLIGIWGSTAEVAEAGPFRYVFRLLDVGGKEYAAMKLTLMLLIGSALILVGLLAMWDAVGGNTFSMLDMQAHSFSKTMQMWAFPALWIGFGTLGGIWPFHTWSPDGHASAPTAVSMLHAGVLMKLGAFGVIRVGMVLLPDGAAAWAVVVGVVAVINIVYGAFCAMGQTDLKYIVAYSSVSHMGIVMLGAATLTIDGWNGAMYQMFAHGIMTALFFALVGLVYDRAHHREIFQMGGFAKKMPGVAVFFTLACLSSLGMPGLAGFVAEFLVFLGAWSSTHAWWAIAGILGAWVTAIYVLRAARAIFWGEGPSKRHEDITDAKGTEWIALIGLAACLVLFGCWPGLILEVIDGTTLDYLSRIVDVAAVGVTR
jgi:NADH-quinone oxidoreductase subunit M